MISIRTKSKLLLATCYFSGAILAGCSLSKNIHIENITQKKLGRKVYVTGKVKEIVPLINTAGYRLQDDTGSVWVITSHSLPTLGAEITIEGKIQIQDIKVNDKNLSEFYLVELQKLPQVSEDKH